mmetsp:Transcript_43676/g.76577  ORF Transcript_43676/g.76577 Transcript_43676/m.76577 type:complete len:347 (-) Transcript_43676:145-1185(-)
MWSPIHDVLSNCKASSWTALNALRVEACSDIHVVTARNTANDRSVVDRMRVRAMQKLFDAHLGQRRTMFHASFKPSSSLVHRLLVQLVLCISRHGHCVGITLTHHVWQMIQWLALEDTDAQASNFWLQIILVMNVSNNWQMVAHTLDLVEDDILVRHHGHWYPVCAKGHVAQNFCPSATAKSNAVKLDLLTTRCANGRSSALVVAAELNAGAFCAFIHCCPRLAGFLGHPNCYVCRVANAIFRRVDATNNAVDLEKRMNLFDFRRGHNTVMRVTESMGHLAVAHDLLHGIFAACDGQGASVCPAHEALAGFIVHLPVGLNSISCQTGKETAALQSSHQSCSVPSCP